VGPDIGAGDALPVQWTIYLATSINKSYLFIYIYIYINKTTHLDVTILNIT